MREKIKQTFTALLAVVVLIYTIAILSKTINISSVKYSVSDKSVRNVYIDLGANNGDSILSFFGMNPNKEYPSILDAETIAQKNWLVYVFEANPAFNSDIVNVVQRVKSKYTNVTFKIFTETAIWIYNGQVKFYLDTVGRKRVSSSLKETHRGVIRSRKVSVNVTCIDIVSLLSEFTKEDLVIMKIDIEGSEYEMLAHMIVNNVVELVDYLAVEYHNNVLEKTPHSLITSESMLDFIIRKFNTKLVKWI